MPATQNRRMVAVILLIPLVALLALWAFAWPSARLAPRDLPVAIAGSAPAADRLQQQFEQRGGAFEVHRYASEDEARHAIENRSVYGAIVASSQGARLLTASAASPAVAQLLREAVTAQAPDGTPVQVTDVVAAPGTDPRGSVLGASFLPLAIAGVLSGSAVTLLRLRGGRAALTLIGVAVTAGLGATALTADWLGVITGNWWAEAGTLGLTVLAIGGTVAGLAALVGPPGIGAGAVLMVLLGNPFSGVTSAPELLPGPVGAIGRLMPPGAGGSLLRSVAFFDGGGAGGPLLVLALWAALGLGAVLIGGRRRTRPPAALPAHTREPALAG
ncbi:ABC transporter permease [Streptomyces sp. NPDC047917]|uniref:ABC transporter permease n=1 Tax=Streptomyces sp. NPDC047917 TaxID=3365491 RepID=UPI003713549E